MCSQGGENHSNGNKYNYWNPKVANPEWGDLHGEELTAQDMIHVCWYGRHQDTQWYSEDRQRCRFGDKARMSNCSAAVNMLSMLQERSTLEHGYRSWWGKTYRPGVHGDRTEPIHALQVAVHRSKRSILTL